MSDKDLSTVPIAEVLAALGARPGNHKNTYHSPFREDRDASLHIDPERNVWFDHGAGIGGGNVDLVMKCRGCTAREAAEYILTLSQGGGGVGCSGRASCNEKPRLANPLTSRILMVRELRSPYLLEYAAARGIPEATIARYCKEVVIRGKANGKTYDHIAFPNNAGGFALKSPSGFKCTTKGGITTIDMAGQFSEKPTSESVTVFEGFFDFLSWLASRKSELPTTDVVVLNSTTNTLRSMPYLRLHKTIICCLDNDEAGCAALETIRSVRIELGNPTIIDGSLFYYGYKDVNEWWMATR